jgi:hypothetical protein
MTKPHLTGIRDRNISQARLPLFFLHINHTTAARNADIGLKNRFYLLIDLVKFKDFYRHITKKYLVKNDSKL